MCKMFFRLSIIAAMFFCNMNVFGQNKINADSIQTKDFSNKFLLNGKTGKIFIISSDNTLNNVIIRWNNGYFGIGSILEGQAVGKWFLYDKKNRHREYLIFGPEGECVVYRKRIDIKGITILESKAITPCF